ncbi:MAG: 4-alpha-glucanotransferase, partial [Candidatus Limnocylindria bacterium]
TVPAGVRDELRRRRVLSTRLALFERVQPGTWPRQSFAGVTTHDLPNMAGIGSGADLHDQSASGLTPHPAGLALLRSRLTRAAGAGAHAPLAEVVERVHRRLAAAPPMLIAATLEDALQVTERPNMPGTVPPHRDNWSLALPNPIEALSEDARVRSTVAALRR